MHRAGTTPFSQECIRLPGFRKGKQRGTSSGGPLTPRASSQNLRKCRTPRPLDGLPPPGLAKRPTATGSGCKRMGRQRASSPVRSRGGGHGARCALWICPGPKRLSPHTGDRWGLNLQVFFQHQTGKRKFARCHLNLKGAQGQFEAPGLLEMAICRLEIYRPRSPAASPSSPISGRFSQNWNNQFEPLQTAWLPNG